MKTTRNMKKCSDYDDKLITKMCRRPARYFEANKWYCGIHSPTRIAIRLQRLTEAVQDGIKQL